MTNYLELAMEQEDEDEERDSSEGLEVPTVGTGGTGLTGERVFGKTEREEAPDENGDGKPVELAEETRKKKQNGERADFLEGEAPGNEDGEKPARRDGRRSVPPFFYREKERKKTGAENVEKLRKAVWEGETGEGRVRALPESGEKGKRSLTGGETLLEEMRKAERDIAFVRGPGKRLTVTLPENGGGERSGFSVEGLDRAVERDARRYDGGSVFY